MGPSPRKPQEYWYSGSCVCALLPIAEETCKGEPQLGTPLCPAHRQMWKTSTPSQIESAKARQTLGFLASCSVGGVGAGGAACSVKDSLAESQANSTMFLH